MPLLKLTEVTENARLAIWMVEEPIEFFIDGLREKMEISDEFIASLHPGRAIEYISARYLVMHHLAEEGQVFESQPSGKPGLENPHAEISLSHCKGHTAALCHPTHSNGVDIEIINHRVEKVKHKFLSYDEQKFYGRNLFLMTLAWSVKETVYKWYGERGIDFIGMIALGRVDYKEQTVQAIFKHPQMYREVTVRYETWDKIMLTYLVSHL